MSNFDKLLEVSDILLGPNGCPWDRKQTFFTLQHYFVEEAHELVEAISDNNDQHILEELGDLFYAVIFLAKLAEKENKFTIDDLLISEKEKLMRRHPHVFGDEKAEDENDVKKIWESVKKKEKKDRKSRLDGIPPTLPLLMRASKVIKRLKEAKMIEPTDLENQPLSEKECMDKLFSLLIQANSSHLSVENLLRKLLQEKENEFRKKEKII